MEPTLSFVHKPPNLAQPAATPEGFAQAAPGEEIEEVLLSCRAELAILQVLKPQPASESAEVEKTWVDSGNGELHFNKGEGFYRIVLTRGIRKGIALNARIVPSMSPKLLDPPGNAIRFVLPVLREPGNGVAEVQLAMLRLENAPIAAKLFELWSGASATCTSG
jgi:hypothetical protein